MSLATRLSLARELSAVFKCTGKGQAFLRSMSLKVIATLPNGAFLKLAGHAAVKDLPVRSVGLRVSYLICGYSASVL